MDRNGRNAAIAGFVIFAAFALGAYFMPSIMLALGEYSPAIAGIVAILFVAAFFAIFYLRARTKDNGGANRD